MLNESAVYKCPRRFLPQTAWSSLQYKDLVAVAINLGRQSAHMTGGFDDKKGIAAFPLRRKKNALN